MTVYLNDQYELNKLMDLFEKLNLFYCGNKDCPPSSLKKPFGYYLFPSKIFTDNGSFAWGEKGETVLSIDHLEGKPINYVLR